MRPNQQNRRMRGRGNRKGPNPLTRSYESNGPDVKIRGSAQQVADKYTTLARDAQASGDRVMAENYLQHAEHYNRIIAAAQSQQQAQRESREEQESNTDEQEQESVQAPENQGSDARAQDGSGPQPVINGTPAEVALEEQSVTEGGGDGERKSAGKTGRRPRRPRKQDTEAAGAKPDQAEKPTPAEDGEDREDGPALAAAGS